MLLPILRSTLFAACLVTSLTVSARQLDFFTHEIIAPTQDEIDQLNLQPNDHLTIYYVDAIKRQEESLISQSLSSNESVAMKQAQALIKSDPHFDQKLERILEAYKEAMYALELGVEKVPALVINRSQVIYGETLTRAIVFLEDDTQ